MNVQQAAAIYVRAVLERSVDEVINLVHDEFNNTHGVELAEDDHQAIYEAIRAVQSEVGQCVSEPALRDASRTLQQRAYTAIEEGGRA